MSGPKHLWSGDWENESRQPAAAQPHVPEHEPQPAPAPATARSRFTRQQFAIALGTGVATATVAIVLIVTLGAGQKPTPRHTATTGASAAGNPQNSGGGGLSTPAQPCQQTAVGCSPTTAAPPTITGPFADWMGMQIVTSPNGVVVNTVRVGSPADQAGFEPGDQIMSIDTHVIGTVSELRTDTNGVRVGAPVTIAVLRSSVQLTLTSIPMTEHPTIHP